jgi:hypothetical protein
VINIIKKRKGVCRMINLDNKKTKAGIQSSYLKRRKKRYIFAALNGPIVQWIE